MADGEELCELDVVRVVGLRCSDREFGGSPGVRRAPRVGDEGTVVHVFDQLDAPVAVEMVDASGLTVWLADFDRRELALVARPGEYPRAPS